MKRVEMDEMEPEKVSLVVVGCVCACVWLCVEVGHADS